MIAAPACRIIYIPLENNENEEARQSQDLEFEDEEFLDVPVYVDSQRNVLICSLPVGCLKDERDVWLRRGIAFHLTSF